MTRTSSGAKKSGPPAHANRFAFTHNPSSRLTKVIAAIPIGQVCPSCVAILEWRKRYRKYKPLKEPRKCVRCNGKTVKDAYHTVCRGCAGREKICAKCLQPRREGEEEQPVDITKLGEAALAQDLEDDERDGEGTEVQVSSEVEN